MSTEQEPKLRLKITLNSTAWVSEISRKSHSLCNSCLLSDKNFLLISDDFASLAIFSTHFNRSASHAVLILFFLIYCYELHVKLRPGTMD